VHCFDGRSPPSILLPKPAKAIETTIETAIGDKGIKTPDLGGTATTEEVGNALIEALQGR